MSEFGRPLWKRIAAASGSLFATVYLLNPGAGVIELIADVFPVVGNLDEAAATGLLLYCLRYLFNRKTQGEAP